MITHRNDHKNLSKYFLFLVMTSLSFQTGVNAEEAIYSMNETEQHIASLLLMDSLSEYLDEEVNINVGNKNTKASEVDLLNAFQHDTRNAVDYFLGTKVRLTGKVSKSGQLSQNQSLVRFAAPGSATGVQIMMAKDEMAPLVKKGTEVSFYCSVTESTEGKILISDCYTRGKAEQLVNIEHMKQLDQFLKGGHPANSTIPTATLWSILAVQYLPKKSACFDIKSRNYRACASEVNNLDKEALRPELDQLNRRLKARGLKI